MVSATQADDGRRRELAAIHINRAKLALDDSAWQGLLLAEFGVTSSAALDAPERRRLIRTLQLRLGESPGAPPGSSPEWGWVDDAPAAKRPMLRKIIVLSGLLGIERGRQLRYVEGIAIHMSGGTARALRMCDTSELYRIIAALNYQNRRRSATA
jgi:hypothetical protein